MDCACLVHKICGYCYYKEEVYVQLIRWTARRYFLVRQHGPASKCSLYIRKTNTLEIAEI